MSFVWIKMSTFVALTTEYPSWTKTLNGVPMTVSQQWRRISELQNYLM